MIEPRCLIGLIDSRDSFQDGFAAPRKGFAGIQWSSALERPGAWKPVFNHLGLLLRPWGLGPTMPEKGGWERLNGAPPFLRFGLSS